MAWILKSITAVQALLLLPLAVSKPGDAAPTPGSPENVSWAESVSIGTPLAFQRFISQYPHSDKVDHAFDRIIEIQVESAKVLARHGGLDAQLAQTEGGSDLDLPPAEDLIYPDPY